MRSFSFSFRTAILRCAGAIPKELGALGKLEDLRLHNNELTGEAAGPAIFVSLFWFRTLVTRLLEHVSCTRLR